MKSDLEIQQDVQNELKWEPLLFDAEIDVHVQEGVVTLTGVVDNTSIKQTATEAAKQVAGVKAVIDSLQTNPDKSSHLIKSAFDDTKNLLSDTDDSPLKISGA